MKTKAEKAAYMREWYQKNKERLNNEKRTKRNPKGAGRKAISYKDLYEGTKQDYKDFRNTVDAQIETASQGKMIIAAASFILGIILGHFI